MRFHVLWIAFLGLLIAGCGTASTPSQGGGTVSPTGPILSVLDSTNSVNGIPNQVEAFQNGKRLWRFAFPTSSAAARSLIPFISSSVPNQTPALAHPLRLQVLAGVVYVGTMDTLYALKETTGQILWQAAAGPTLYSLTVDQGTVYVSSEGVVSAFAAQDGTLRWHEAVSYGGTLFPIVVNNGTAYVFGGSLPGLTALNAQTGQPRWTIQADQLNFDPIGAVFPVNDLALAYILGGTITAFSVADGSVRWHIPDTVSILGLTQEQLYTESASFSSSNELRVYQLSDGTLMRHSALLSTASKLSYLTPDAQDLYFAGGPSGGDLSAWRSADGSQRWQVPSSDTDSALFADAQAAYTASAQGVTAWRAADGGKLWQNATATNLVQLQEDQGLLFGVNQQHSRLVALTPTTGKQAWDVQTAFIDSYVLA